MKKRLMTKAGAIFLAACVGLSTIPTTAFATSSTQIEQVVDSSNSSKITESTNDLDTTNTTDSSNTSVSTDSTENTDTSITEETNSLDTTDTANDKDTDTTSNTTDTSDTTDTNSDTTSTDTTQTSVDADNTDTSKVTDTTSDSNETNETIEASNTENEDTSTEIQTDKKAEEQTEESLQEDDIDRQMGYNSIEDLKIPSVYDGSFYLNSRGTLPSSYDSRTLGYITPVRDQGSWGSCWAFSAIAMAEANLVKKGLASSSLDLSELQLAYFFYNTVADPLGNTTGDSTKALLDGYLNQGGNSVFTTFALASWISVADESKAPYENATSANYALNTSLAFDDAYHMQNAYWINMTDVSDVKNMIMQYGAVGASYYSDQDGNEDTKYYNSANAAYYYNGEFAEFKNQFYINHAILIVGWDDNFDKSNFNDSPDNNGAWLVKNSWGTEFGKSGYFWISYEDDTLTDADSSQAFVFDFESADNYDHNYQYDGSSAVYGSSVTNGGSIGNVFTAKANASGGAENIEAVSFALYDVNVDYSIQIYTNLSNSNDPTSGTAMLSTPKKGTTSYVGYYTIPLDNAIEVAEGTNFSVVITLSRSASDSVYYFCDNTYTNGNWIRFTNATQAGQSFVKTSSKSGWSDLASAGLTARIKAFTTDIELTQPTGISLNKSSLSLKAGATATLTATTTPIAVASGNITWSTSNKSVATVDSSGIVTATGIGTAVITATTSNGLTATCEVTGKIGKVSGLKASQTTKQVKLSWTKQNGVTGYQIYRYNSSTKKYEKIATNKGASKTTYTDKSREAGTTYQYKVRAYVKVNSKNTYGSYSSVLKTSTKTVAPTLKGTAQSKKAKLTWGKVNNATGYEIYMSTSKSSGYSLVKTITKGKTVSYTKTGLKKNTKYYFKIRAYKKVSGIKIYSGYSKVVTVKVK